MLAQFKFLLRKIKRLLIKIEKFYIKEIANPKGH